MEKKKTKPGPAAVKGTPAKPVRKKRRILLWFFLFMFIIGGVTLTGIYNRWFPLDPEMDAKIDPYRERAASLITSAEGLAATAGELVTSAGELVKKAEPWLEKIGIGKKTTEDAAATQPQTNFPLVELGKDDQKVVAPVEPTAGPGSPAIASAAPGQPPGAVKPATSLKADPETVKVFGKLAKLYSAMKAEEAVAVFSNLEDEQVVMILSRMEEEAAAKILATLEPKRAARLTQAMIKRK
jgi:hypothetical protein